MDASAGKAATDALGRLNGPRRKYTMAEKRAIVEETRQRGASGAARPSAASRGGRSCPGTSIATTLERARATK